MEYIPPGEEIHEDWNGVAWTEVADLSSGRQSPAGAGTTTAGLAFAGTSFWNKFDSNRRFGVEVQTQLRY